MSNALEVKYCGRCGCVLMSDSEERTGVCNSCKAKRK